MYITDIEIPIPPYEKIKKHIKVIDKSITELSQECEVCLNHMSGVLSGKRNLGKKLRSKINHVLGTTY